MHHSTDDGAENTGASKEKKYGRDREDVQEDLGVQLVDGAH